MLRSWVLFFGGVLAATLGWWLLVPAVDRPPEVSAVRSTASVPASAPSLAGVEPVAPAGETCPDAAPLAQAGGGDVRSVWLSIGEGCSFAEGVALREGVRDTFDVYCQDIHGSVSLACPHGAAPALSPLNGVGLPAEPDRAVVLLRSAPERLPDRNLELAERVAVQRPGIGFVQARTGTVYRTHLAQVEHHPEALRRRALVRYAPIAVEAGGGEFHLPVVDGQRPVPEPARASIRHALAYGERWRGASFIDHLSGEYAVVTGLLPETVVDPRRHLLVEEALATHVTFPRRGALFAAGGIAEGGHVTLASYAGVGTRGDMAGRVDVNSYGYVYIDGDLTGTVNVNSYASVVIEGDLRGTLNVRSYTHLLLRGRILGKLDCRGSCWCTFYLETFLGRADLEALGKEYGSVTLHLRASDLPAGKHEGVGSWREVIVADPVWERLAPR